MNRRGILRSAVAAATAALGANRFAIPARAQTKHIRLYVEMDVAPGREREMLAAFHDTFVPEAAKHEGYIRVKMLKRRSITNKQRGTANYQFWTNEFNALTEQQKLTFDDRAKAEFDQGRSHNLSLTAGGPVLIPGLLDGRGKLFYFGNYSYANDAIPGKIQGSITVPANAKHPQGDFSDLLTLPNPAQYQIHDPLTTRPDPTNPSRMIRDPFPNNINPRARIFNPDGSYKNPLMDLYAKLVPQPNQNFIDAGQQPTGNFYQGGQPDSPVSHQYGFRVDLNATAMTRLNF